MNDSIDSSLAVPAGSPLSDYALLASAMKKLLPPALLAEVIAHLDPVTPFVEFLRSSEAAGSPLSEKEKP